MSLTLLMPIILQMIVFTLNLCPYLIAVLAAIRITVLSHNSMNAEMCEPKNIEKCDLSMEIDRYWLNTCYSHSLVEFSHIFM